MSDSRRKPRAGKPGSRGRRGPGRGAPGRGSRGTGPIPVVGSDDPRPSVRSRFTGRAAILVLVLAVLAVSYASSMRAFLQQRAHLDELREQISERQGAIDGLEREKRRWNDPAYVRTMARERLGYVMPGDIAYVALGADGKPLESEASLTDPTDEVEEPTAWWEAAWGSVELAGNPPKDQPLPLNEIDGSEEDE